MTQPILHITFSMSAAADLRRALAHEGRDERVVALGDCLSFGPINPSDPQLRARWVETELGYTGWDEIGKEAEEFWRAALADEQNRVVWTSRRSTQEFSGFLEFVWRNGDKSFDVIDLSDVAIAPARPSGGHKAASVVGTLALILSEEIVANQLWTRTERSSANQDENAALRVLDDELNLVSAAISHLTAACCHA
jgi:hypothetical protein